MRLPEGLALKYHHEVIELEKEMNVNYLTNAEYFGHQEGLREGIYKTNRENARKMLAIGLNKTMIASVTNLSEAELDVLSESDD